MDRNGVITANHPATSVLVSIATTPVIKWHEAALIAEDNKLQGKTDKDYLGIQLFCLEAEKEALLNAHLISAAPDLLEAAKDTAELWIEWACSSELLSEPLKRSIEMRIEQLQAAIKKAEGG
jgi:hypothetical protein